MRCPIMKNIKKYNRYNIPKKNDDFVMKILRIIFSFSYSFFLFWFCLFFGLIGWLLIAIIAFISSHTIFEPFDI